MSVRTVVLDRVVRTFSQSETLEPRPDADLVQMFVHARDERAFEQLVWRHGPMVVGVCRRMLGNEADVEDVFQATFLVLARKADSLQRQAEVAGWLFGVARRLAQGVRSQSARRGRLDAHIVAREIDERQPYDDISLREAQTILDDEIERLPEKYRSVVVLCCLGDHSRESAAHQLGLTPSLVKTRLEEARRRLRERLTRRGVMGSSGMVAGLFSSAGEVSANTVAHVMESALAFRAGTLGESKASLLAQSLLTGMSAAKQWLGAVLGLGLVLVTLGFGFGKSSQPPAVQGDDKPMSPQPRIDRLGDALPPGAEMRLGTVRLRHSGWSPDMLFADDGRTLLTSNENNVVRFWEVKTGKLLRELPVPDQTRLITIALSPDEKLLATGGYKGAQLWEVKTGKKLRQVDAGSVGEVVFTPDGAHLVTGKYEAGGDVQLFEVATGKKVRDLPSHRSEVHHLCTAAKGESVLSVSTSAGSIVRTIRATGTVAKSLTVKAEVRKAAFSKDGKWVALSGFRDGLVGGRSIPWARIYDSTSLKEVGKLEGHEKEFGGLAFTPSGEQIVSVEGPVMCVWDRKTGNRLKTFRHPDHLFSGQLRVSPDGKTVAVRVAESIQLWDLETGLQRWRRKSHLGIAGTLSFSPDGRRLASGSMEDQTVRIWDLATARELAVLRHPGYVRSVVFSRDGHSVVSGGGDSLLRLWNLKTRKVSRTFEIQGKHQVMNLDLSRDGKQLAVSSGGFDESSGMRLTVFDFDKGQRSFVRENVGGWFNYPGISRKFDQLAVALGKDIEVQDARTGGVRQTLTAPKAFVLSEPFVFSSNGKRLAVRSSRPCQQGNRFFRDKHCVRVFDIETGRRTHHFTCKPWGGPMVFHPTKPILAYSSAKEVVLVDLRTSKRIRTLRGIRDRVSSLAFSRDGKRLAVGSQNSSILLYRMK